MTPGVIPLPPFRCQLFGMGLPGPAFSSPSNPEVLRATGPLSVFSAPRPHLMYTHCVGGRTSFPIRCPPVALLDAWASYKIMCLRQSLMPHIEHVTFFLSRDVAGTHLCLISSWSSFCFWDLSSALPGCCVPVYSQHTLGGTLCSSRTRAL